MEPLWCFRTTQFFLNLQYTFWDLAAEKVPAECFQCWKKFSEKSLREFKLYLLYYLLTNQVAICGAREKKTQSSDEKLVLLVNKYKENYDMFNQNFFANISST